MRRRSPHFFVIDPYNDFISEGGKLWDRVGDVPEANNCVPHMLQVLNAARKVELRVFYTLHHRYRPAAQRPQASSALERQWDGEILSQGIVV
jgi:hypothetical protein